MELSSIAKQINSDYIHSMSVLSGVDRVVVYVEGWDDVAFWSGVFSDFPACRFDIMPPVRDDLSKGKRVVLSFAANSGRNLFLAVDSDFDWIFNNNPLMQCKWLVQTYAYSIENLQCEPSSLNNVLSRSVKLPSNFDFVSFFKTYSAIIYPLFLWYIWSAYSLNSSIVPVKRFSNAVRFHNLTKIEDIPQGLARIANDVKKTVNSLSLEYPQFSEDVVSFGRAIKERGVTEEMVSYFMQGHALKDKVVMPLLQMFSSVYTMAQIDSISNTGAVECVKENQIDYFKNAIAPIKYCLDENLGYKKTPFYDKIARDINNMLSSR